MLQGDLAVAGLVSQPVHLGARDGPHIRLAALVSGQRQRYGNMWDVMSVDGPCRTEPGYGRIGQHPIAYQKDILGWIPAERIFVAWPDSQTTITLEQPALPASSDYLLARNPSQRLQRGQALLHH